MRKMKPSGVEWIGDIPQEWEVIKLKYATEFKQIKYSEEYGELNYIGLENIISWNGMYLETSSQYDREQSLICEENDILFGKLRPYLAKVYLNTKRQCCSSEFCVIKILENHTKYFWYQLISHGFIFMVDRSTYGTKMPRANSDFIRSLYVNIPPLPEQQRIAEFLDRKCAEIDSIIAKTKATIEEYKALKQAVITQAVTKGIRPDRPMKDSGVEWIGDIPQEWDIVKMKHLGRCRNGLTYSPENVVDEEIGTLVLRSSNIKDGNLMFSDNVFVNNDIREELMVKQGDILICSRNGSRSLIGKNAIIPKNLVATFGAFMMIFRCDKPEYVRYILSSQIFSYYLGTFLTSTINQLTADNFNNMQVVYCQDEREQVEIITYLDHKCAEIDRLIAAKEQLLTELESYKKSVIYEYVTGKKEV